MLSKGKTIILPLFILLIWGCQDSQHEDDNNIIASVHGKNLKTGDLKAIMPIYPLTEEDSAEFVVSYIKQWIKQQLLVEEAKKVLSPEEQDISSELEQYEQQLLIHKYKNKKINSIDYAVITDDSIVSYYEANIEKFLLKFPIVKVKYIVFPPEMEISPEINKALMSSESFSESVNDYIYSYATKYDNFNNQWISFNNLFLNTQHTPNNPLEILKQNRFISFESNNEKHIIIVEAYHLPGERSPLEFVKERIRNMLINNKKIDFLREIKDSLYNHALKYNNFKALNQ